MCEKNKIKISVSQKFYLEFDAQLRNSYMYMSPTPSNLHNSCQATLLNSSYHFVLDLPFHACGTMLAHKPNAVAFTNKIWINRHLSGDFDMPVPVVQFTCIYSSEYSVLMALQPIVGQHIQNVTTNGNFAASMQLCKMDTCPFACPSEYSLASGAVYTVGDRVHITILTSNITQSIPNNTSITVKEIFLSCSTNNNSSRAIQLITNGCPYDSGISASITTGTTGKTANTTSCVSFQLPRSTNAECSSLYIHVTLMLCASRHPQTCPSSPLIQRCKTRSKRSTDVDEFDVVTGPIAVISGSSGRRFIDLWDGDKYSPLGVDGYQPLGADWGRNSPAYELLGKSEESTEFGNQMEYTWFIIGTTAITLCVIALIVGILRTIFRNCFTSNVMQK
uniref:ZP domain-containing protein n=1 Tax=Ciona savignyi TaxID=51511 RepID=H2ZQY0_CIOSA